MKLIENKGYPYIWGWGKNSAVKWLAVLFFEILIAGFVITSPLALLIFVVASIVIIPLLVRPEYSLYALFFFIIPGASLSFTLSHVTLKISHLLVFVALSSGVMARLAKTRPPFHGTGCDQPLLILWAWALLSLTWSHDRIVGVEDLLKLSAAVILVFFIGNCVRSQKTLRFALGVFIFMGLIDATTALLYPYTDFFIRKKWTFLETLVVTFKFWPKHIVTGAAGRCMGFFTAHGTAVTLSFAIMFCMMFFLVTQNIKKRIILMGFALFLFAATVGTLTKSMIICVLISTAYVILHLKPFRQRLFTSLFVVFMLIISSFVVTRLPDIKMSSSYVVEGLKVKSEEQDETSVSQRIDMAVIGLRKLWETGGLGTGIGGFLSYTPFNFMDGSHPAILWDLGFVGLAVWIWLLMGAYRLFVMAIRNSNNEYYRRMLIVYLGGYVNVLISWFVTFAYADIYIWFYLGIGFALAHLAQTEPFDDSIRLPFSSNGGSIVIL